MQADTIQKNVFIRKSFYRFFMPSLLSCLGLAIGGIADCVFVGNVVGTAGLSAISIGQPIYMLFNTVSYSLSIGGSIHYATVLGEGREEEGNRIFANVLRADLIVNITLCVLGLLFLPQVLAFLGAGAPGTEVYKNCEQLVRTQLILVPVMFCQGPFYYFVNCDNNPKLAAAALVTSNSIDVLFNYVFVVICKMGVAGSVYSTGLGAAVMILISLTHFIRKKGCLRLSWPKFDLKEVVKSFKTGFATSIQYVFQFFTILICNRLLMTYSGELGVAVFDIVFNVALLTSSVYDAISMALQPMISTFHGERNKQNIRDTLRESFLAAVCISVVVAAVLLAVPHWVCYAFGLRSAAELTTGAYAVRIYALCVLPAGVNMVMTYYYQALGREFNSYLIFTLRSLLFFLAFSFLFGLVDPTLFWWTYPCTEAATLLVLSIYNKIKGTWVYLDEDDSRVYSAFLYSGTAKLGQVEQEVNQYMDGLDASPTQSYFATIAVEEICGVIMNNAFSQKDGYIQLTIVPNEDGSVSLHLRDNAREFNPFGMDTKSISLENGTGLDAIGVKVIKSKAKEFFYRRYAGFNTLVVRV